MHWADIDWDARRLRIYSSKTEHHEGHAKRVIPLFPATEFALRQLRVDQLRMGVYQADGEVFPDVQADTNLRTHFESIIRRAGVEQWPKLWQNLRASAATDMAKKFPAHVAAKFCGHSSEVAQEHYWTTTEADLDAALSDGFGSISHRNLDCA